MSKLQKGIEGVNLIGSYKARTNKREVINLIGDYKAKRNNSREDYKAQYNRMFPTKLSSSNFLSLYTLFLLDKSTRPLYGTEMLKKMRGLAGSSIWNPSNGTYYPLLSQMEKDGFIEKVTSIESKNFYEITELGKQELEVKLEEYQKLIIGGITFFSKAFDEFYNN